MAGETHPAVPPLAGGWLILPLENAGLGPAINVRARLDIASPDPAEPLEAGVGVMAAGGRAALRFAVQGPVCDFEVRLSYQDHLARVHGLNARWSLRDRSYALDW